MFQTVEGGSSVVIQQAAKLSARRRFELIWKQWDKCAYHYKKKIMIVFWGLWLLLLLSSLLYDDDDDDDDDDDYSIAIIIFIVVALLIVLLLIFRCCCCSCVYITIIFFCLFLFNYLLFVFVFKQTRDILTEETPMWARVCAEVGLERECQRREKKVKIWHQFI